MKVKMKMQILFCRLPNETIEGGCCCHKPRLMLCCQSVNECCFCLMMNVCQLLSVCYTITNALQLVTWMFLTACINRDTTNDGGDERRAQGSRINVFLRVQFTYCCRYLRSRKCNICVVYSCVAYQEDWVYARWIIIFLACPNLNRPVMISINHNHKVFTNNHSWGFSFRSWLFWVQIKFELSRLDWLRHVSWVCKYAWRECDHIHTTALCSDCVFIQHKPHVSVFCAFLPALSHDQWITSVDTIIPSDLWVWQHVC